MKQPKSKTNKPGGSKKLTRKDIRKLKRVEKREKKHVFFTRKSAGLVKETPECSNNAKKVNCSKANKSKLELISTEHLRCDDDESIDSDFSDEEIDCLIPAAIKSKIQEQKNKRPNKQLGIQRVDPMEAHQRELKKQKELEMKARKERLKQLKLENEEEDRAISKLEKQLRLNKSKEKSRLINKLIVGDDMEDLCNVLMGVEEFMNLSKKKSNQNEKRIESYDEDEDEEEEDVLENLSEEDNGGDKTDDNDRKEEASENSEPKYTEDIYGRKRDKEGNIVPDSKTRAENLRSQKYVPPHQRTQIISGNSNSEKQPAEILVQLQRRCKGLLNRLSEANLHKIAVSVEELYMRNSRYNMNDALVAQVTDDLIAEKMCSERMVQEHMVLLAYLHAHIGSEIGAHFLQTFIGRFDQLVKSVQILEISDKRLNNLTLVLSYMYIFKIYDHRLLLEIIAYLVTQLCEKAIECLLVIFHSVGFKLRKDDPVAFKEMMINVQQKVAAAPLELKENIRLKFLVDTLMAVKNNNAQKLPQYDPELAGDLLKKLNAMSRSGCSVVTLNITLSDLLSADKVGKWWIVGSAWCGNINKMSGTDSGKNQKGSGSERFSDKLMDLAKKQQMNTSERRNIFCIIMSADDCTDAFEKILHLSLKGQRDVAYVIIHCCINQKKPNPYFSHLALTFCQNHRDNRHTFKRASQDRIKDIESLSKLQIRNFAHFLTHLIICDAMHLDVLEGIDLLEFVKTKSLPASCYLVKEIMLRLLLDDNRLGMMNAFDSLAKAVKKPEIRILKRDIGLFISQFLLNKNKVKLPEKKYDLLRRNIEDVSKSIYIDNLAEFLK